METPEGDVSGQPASQPTAAVKLMGQPECLSKNRGPKRGRAIFQTGRFLSLLCIRFVWSRKDKGQLSPVPHKTSKVKFRMSQFIDLEEEEEEEKETTGLTILCFPSPLSSFLRIVLPLVSVMYAPGGTGGGRMNEGEGPSE